MSQGRTYLLLGVKVKAKVKAATGRKSCVAPSDDPDPNRTGDFSSLNRVCEGMEMRTFRRQVCIQPY
jgi:hypothetical protein